MAMRQRLSWMVTTTGPAALTRWLIRACPAQEARSRPGDHLCPPPVLAGPSPPAPARSRRARPESSRLQRHWSRYRRIRRKPGKSSHARVPPTAWTAPVRGLSAPWAAGWSLTRLRVGETGCQPLSAAPEWSRCTRWTS